MRMLESTSGSINKLTEIIEAGDIGGAVLTQEIKRGGMVYLT